MSQWVITGDNNMKKFYFLLATALLFAGPLFAADPNFGETVADNAFPYQRYLTGFYFNRQTQEFSFTDTYQQGTALVRDYYVYAIQRVDGNGFYVGGQSVTAPCKVLRDRHIYIIAPDGKEFDATGAKVK